MKMFKIPEFEDDVPKNHMGFAKSLKKKFKPVTIIEIKGNDNNSNVIEKLDEKSIFSVKEQKKKKSRKRNKKNKNTELSDNSNINSSHVTVGRFVLNPNASIKIGQNLNIKKNKQKQTIDPNNSKTLKETPKKKKSIKNKQEDINNSIINKTEKTKQDIKKNKSNKQDIVEQKQKTNNESKKLKDSQNEKTAIKRKHEDINDTKTNKSMISDSNMEIDTEKLDQVILNAKKKKLEDVFAKDVDEENLFKENNKKNIKSKKKKKSVHEETINKNLSAVTKSKEEVIITNGDLKVNKNLIRNDAKKKEKLSKTLQLVTNRTPIQKSGNKLRERMLEKLKSAQFRYINEKLYTSSGTEAKELFQTDPTAFQTYHEGYQQQIKKWPVNPLDVIVTKILKMPKSNVIADLGCGEAALSKRVPHDVRSFDLVAREPSVVVCDMAHTPLCSASVDAAVYCLALMGTELTQYLVEANRILKLGGELLIAEVESRFDDVEAFSKEVQKLGFKLKNLDKSHQVFFFLEFKKVTDPPVKKSKLPTLTLKPCFYKRR